MDKSYFLFYLDSRQELEPGATYTVGRSHKNHIFLPHLSVSRYHASLVWDETSFKILDLASTNGVYVNNRKVNSRLLINGDKLRIGGFNLQFVVRDGNDEEEVVEPMTPSQTLAIERTVAELLQNVQDPALAAKIMDLKHSFEKRTKELSDLAFRDKLTRIFNRRYFDEKLSEDVNNALTTLRPLCLVMIDIDHFKMFNDTYGHQTGDEVMRVVAGILCNNVRSDDTVARYGGEEIAVILPGVEISRGLKIAERFRTLVSDVTLDQIGVQVTISLGVAVLSESISTAPSLIQAADNALYRAKQNGRNQVVMAEP